MKKLGEERSTGTQREIFQQDSLEFDQLFVIESARIARIVTLVTRNIN